jgi:F0F1-type ATP synthase beta subunit
MEIYFHRREFVALEIRDQILDARDLSLLGVRTEINLDRKIAEKRVYPAIDVLRSSTRSSGPLVVRPRTRSR